MDGGFFIIVELIFSHLATVLGLGLGLLLTARILTQADRPAVSIAWILAIVFIPYVAVPAYFIFGGRKIRHRARGKKELYPRSASRRAQTASHYARLENIFIAAGMPPARTHNEIDFIADGEQAYAALVSKIESAERSIDITTFILGRDHVGRTLVDLLARRAAEGVRVRLLLDALWCWRTRGRFVQKLRDAGGKVGVFMPVLPIHRKWSANLRNHRKIAIFDDREAIIGGMNLAHEYMGPHPAEDRFVDTSVIVRGPVVADLGEVFALDWEFATDEPAAPAVPPEDQQVSGETGAVAQVVASGPDIQGEPLYEALMAATYAAQERVWILTPYFIPDTELLRALLLQARLGRDVRIIVPARSNHIIPDIVRGRFLRRMREAGARVYCYQGRMLHAKHLVFDHDLTVTGSPNFDMRSMYLNYEVAMFMYSRREIEHIADWMLHIMGRSTAFDEMEAGPLRRWAEGLGFLLSPLL